MPGKVAKIGTFSDWVGLFDEWRKEIGVDTRRDRQLQVRHAVWRDRDRGNSVRLVQRPSQVGEPPPSSDAADARRPDEHDRLSGRYGVCFSVEQQRHLFETAPTDWDRRALTRVMIEEMRHGWQMCALLRRSLRLLRQSRSPEDAGAPRVRERASAGCVQRRCRQLDGLLHLHRLCRS